jgi:hypothetical protein
MKRLLDTHRWIWAFHNPEKLSRRVRRERLRVKPGFWQSLDAVLARVPLREAPFTFAVAAAVFPAAAFDLTLVTTAAQLLACSWLKTMPND